MRPPPGGMWVCGCVGVGVGWVCVGVAMGHGVVVLCLWGLFCVG